MKSKRFWMVVLAAATVAVLWVAAEKVDIHEPGPVAVYILDHDNSAEKTRTGCWIDATDYWWIPVPVPNGVSCLTEGQRR